MYSVLIVDDEPLARQSLRYLIDWKSLGYHIAAEAADGAEALAIMKAQPISLVLTDIRMPVMNGLAFVERLREFSEAAVIVLSGYDDFEYARQGMKMGVKDYLLKPVDEDDLEALLSRISAELAARSRLDRQQHLGESMLREQLLRRWTQGQIGAAEFGERRHLLPWRDPDGVYVCLLAEMDFVYGSGGLALSERDVALKRFAVLNIAEELCMGLGSLFEAGEDRYGIVLRAAEAAEAEPGEAGDRPVEASQGETGDRSAEALAKAELLAEMLAARIAESVALYAKESVTVGVGHAVADPMRLADSFAAAEEALAAKFLHGGGAVLRPLKPPAEAGDAGLAGGGCDADGSEAAGLAGATGAGDRPAEPVKAIMAQLERVLAAVRSQDRAGAELALTSLRQALPHSGMSAGAMRTAVLYALVQLFQLLKEQGADPSPLFAHEIGDYARVMTTKTADELLRFAEGKYMGVLEQLARMRAMKPNRVIAEARAMIDAHYSDNISLRSIADQVYLNPNHLGKLFKSVTGLSFNDYLLQVRMEHAKRMLRDTDLKVYEIAASVGYTELDWFYKRFKAFTGVSAGEYRAGAG
ncbi:response regulator transcription factor [Cohnella sp. JJ-181]|uniref:response regulator transcription factor n=1 Tax=Cohnella rhizoplanae TaxID=2974897 RepID=UPI0022FFAFA6|nr:response regulator [Cohnella sp. JJ-181]CAI6078204.1 Regulator of RpoS [Cohnella sp. JJ-181]